jgi:hypothetical protein
MRQTAGQIGIEEFIDVVGSALVIGVFAFKLSGNYDTVRL